MEKEIWKDIVGYDGLYQVSNFGNIKSKERIVKNGNRVFLKKEKILTPFLQKTGYLTITLLKDNKIKSHYIHRLVAITFIKNNFDLEQVNHKDGNKINNNANNLEWCSRSDNIKHAIKIGLFSKDVVLNKINKMNKKKRKSILQIKNNVIINEFESPTIAGKQFSKLAGNNISACARGILKSAYGFQWKYKDII